MKIDSEDEVELGLDCYDPEHRVFPKIADSRPRPKLSKHDLLLILKWKLGRIKDSNSETVADDNMATINQAVEDAGNANSDIQALKALVSVPGIGLAAASAILTVCYPEKFTIIDQRALETLDLFPSKLREDERKEYKTDDWSPADYVQEYLPKVRDCSQRWRRSLRDADRALWGLSVNQRVEAIIAKSEVRKA